MNKTQKSALFSLINFLLLIIFSINSTKVIRDVFSPEGCPNALKIVLFWAFLIFGFMALSAFLLYRRKQSSAEVESDERDDLIKKRAVLICFISVWFLLITSYAILWHIVGLNGSIPLCILPLIYLGVFFAVILVYNVAVLIQYGWGCKDGEK
ncbi:MAG TPA: hypothetical protein HPP66_14510 [Planctomycetes bacterium]|nr:hypothetical protein [Planctomycetota bacterium]